MKILFRLLILVFFTSYGLYIMSLAIQSASFSVAASGLVGEFYKTKATLLFPYSLILITQGFIIFFFLKRK